MPVQTCLELALLVLVLAAAASDLATRRIPNVLLLLAWLVALPLQLAAGALADCLLGALAGLLLFLPLYLLRGMAAGDVKLMATVGAFAGPAAALHIALLAWCAGGVMALVLVAFQRRLRAACANLRDLLRPMLLRAAGMPLAATPLPRPSVGAMPYGLAVALATVGWLWAGHG
ncbi:prepilin peptidase [Massilia agilis]|uniref:Prepilin peptidase n=1 Tax=Massilia agilis TaxID=1811226 RepID=A0ABT2DFJ1_9BURK|nr:prepilin peptidase [Massilia agilis]MCS0809178.1 prepilin peptidase [Massilia agilis]